MRAHGVRGGAALLVVGAVLMLAFTAGGCNRSSSGGGDDPAPPPAGGGAGGGGGGGGGTTPPTPFVHTAVVLRDVHGTAIPPGSTEPYSPRQTCGATGCHDVDLVTTGYHFQQGRTDANGNVVVKDDFFNDGRTFVRSAGMYGKW